MKKQEKNYTKYFMSAVLIFLMVISVFGFVATGNIGGNSSAGDYSVRQHAQGVWVLSDGESDLVFYNNPQTVAHVEVPLIDTLTEASVLNLVFDESIEDPTTQDVIRFEFDQVGAKVGTFIQHAKTEGGLRDLPVMSCADATSAAPVLILALADEAEVSGENNCVRVASPNEATLLLYAERVMFGMLEVI